jgi:single-strand DNA-binding protein
MIKLQVIGNLGKDCVVNNVNGKSVINFNVAHSEKYKDAQGVQKDRTIWVDCAYWTDRTAIAPYLKKGTTVFVEGQPDVRAYTTQDGRQGASLTLRIVSVQLIGGRTNADGSPQQNGNEGGNYNSTPSAAPVSYENTKPTITPSQMNEPVDDLPF